MRPDLLLTMCHAKSAPSSTLFFTPRIPAHAPGPMVLETVHMAIVPRTKIRVQSSMWPFEMASDGWRSPIESAGAIASVRYVRGRLKCGNPNWRAPLAPLRPQGAHSEPCAQIPDPIKLRFGLPERHLGF